MKQRLQTLTAPISGFLLAGLLAACGAESAPASAPALSAAPKPASEAASAPSSASAQPASAAPSAKPAASAAAATSGAAGASPLTPPVSIKIGTLGQPAEAGNFWAIERGYFKDEGLDASLVPFGSAPDEIPPMFNGDIQFAVGQPNGAFYNAAARDLGFKIITTMANYGADTKSGSIVVRSDLVDTGRYKDPKDLKGMRIGQIGPAGATQMYIERAVAKAGLQSSDVTLVVLGIPDAVAALGNKNLDASFLFEPFTITAEDKQIAKREIPVGTLVAPGSAAGVVMVSGDYAAKQPEVVKRYVTAHLRAQRDYYAAFYKGGDKEPFFQNLAKYSALKDVNLLRRIEPNIVDPNGGYDDSEFSLMQDFFIRVGVQKDKVPLDKIIDRSYVDYAVQRLGKV
jgi:NitT/TauT family transport system substrate-binding protein